MLKLYYSPGACALASHIALEEAGAAHELVRIDLRKGEQKTPEYLAINPAGVTPALATEHGVLTQNSAILAYVAALRPQAGLAPEGAFDLARFHAFNGFLASSLHPALGQLLFAGLEGPARETAAANAAAKLTLVEERLLTGPWALGERYSAADGYLSVFSRWARQAGLLDPKTYPRLNDHLDRVQARPAVRRALEAEGVSPV